MGGLADVAVVEPRHLKPLSDKAAAELVVPVEHVSADTHDQQQRIPGGTETLIGQVNSVVWALSIGIG